MAAGYFDDETLKNFLKEQEEARLRFMKKQEEERRLAWKKYHEDEARKKEELKREIEEYDKRIAEEKARYPIEETGVSLAVDDEEPGEEFLEIDRPDFEATQTVGRGRKKKRSSKTKKRGGRRRSIRKRSRRRNN